VWRQPEKGVWAPKNVCAEEGITNFQRSDRNLERTSCYLEDVFKKKFGITIRKKTKKAVHLPIHLLDSEDGMMFTPLEKIKNENKRAVSRRTESSEDSEENDFL